MSETWFNRIASNPSLPEVLDPADYYGRYIVATRFETSALYLTLETGKTLRFFDNAKVCCETRFMTYEEPFTIKGKRLEKLGISGAQESTLESGRSVIRLTADIMCSNGGLLIVTFNNYYVGFVCSVFQPLLVEVSS